MGWWSCTVMGGDEPYDYLGGMEDILGFVDKNYDEVKLTPTERRDRVNKNIDKLVKYADKHVYEGRISYHVLGVIIITNGAKMTATLRKDIVDAIKEDMLLNGDGWKNPAERKKYMDHFKRQIQRYPLNVNARPRTVAFEGLFDAIGKHFSKGKSGLVNQNQ